VEPHRSKRVRIQGEPSIWVHQPGYQINWLKVSRSMLTPCAAAVNMDGVLWFLVIGIFPTAAAWIFRAPS